jgi:hypothetical protein
MNFRPFDPGYDATWYGGIITIWAGLEVHLGVICGCLPTFKTFIRYYWPKQKPLDTQSSFFFTINNTRATTDSRGQQTWLTETVEDGANFNLVSYSSQNTAEKKSIV